jgi:hypothetical protein
MMGSVKAIQSVGKLKANHLVICLTAVITDTDYVGGMGKGNACPTFIRIK